MGYKTILTWTGTYFYNKGDDSFDVDFKAHGSHWYQKETRLEPEEDELDVEEVEILGIKENQKDVMGSFTDATIEELKERIITAIYNGDYDPEYPDEDDFDC